MKNLVIPTISQKEFMARLKKNPIEDVLVVDTIEKFFQTKRGYVFRIPKPGTPVIHMVSGGIESTILWALMLEKYKLCVYPLFLRRGEKRWKKEWKAVEYFTDYFRKRHPTLFHEPRDSGLQVVSLWSKTETSPYDYYHPERILDNYHVGKGISTIFSQGGFPIAYPLYGLSYARYLWNHMNVKIDYFFNGVAPGDGDFVSSQTFAALRTTMLTMSIASANDDLQFGSLAFEKECGLWLQKKDLIALGDHMGLPLERTWSCYQAKSFQCGDGCLTCYYRRVAFTGAGVTDRTPYYCDTVTEKAKRWISGALKQLTDPKGVATVKEETTWKREEVTMPWRKNSKRKSRIRNQKTNKSFIK